jgi:natural product precursor
MKKNRKLVLNRETLHSLELRRVAGGWGQSLALCGGGTGTATTNTSNTVNGCYTNTVDCQSSYCTTGGACTV